MLSQLLSCCRGRPVLAPSFVSFYDSRTKADRLSECIKTGACFESLMKLQIDNLDGQGARDYTATIDASNPPNYVTVAIPGCEGARQGACPIESFVRVARSRMDMTAVAKPAYR